jgi:hypothetical protein
MGHRDEVPCIYKLWGSLQYDPTSVTPSVTVTYVTAAQDWIKRLRLVLVRVAMSVGIWKLVKQMPSVCFLKRQVANRLVSRGGKPCVGDNTKFETANLQLWLSLMSLISYTPRLFFKYLFSSANKPAITL